MIKVKEGGGAFMMLVQSFVTAICDETSLQRLPMLTYGGRSVHVSGDPCCSAWAASAAGSAPSWCAGCGGLLVNGGRHLRGSGAQLPGMRPSGRSDRAPAHDSSSGDLERSPCLNFNAFVDPSFHPPSGC